MLSDVAILSRIGNHMRSARLRQNITQQSLADAAGVSLSSLKKIEKGEIVPREVDRFGRTVHVYDVGVAAFLCE